MKVGILIGIAVLLIGALLYLTKKDSEGFTSSSSSNNTLRPFGSSSSSPQSSPGPIGSSSSSQKQQQQQLDIDISGSILNNILKLLGDAQTANCDASGRKGVKLSKIGDAPASAANLPAAAPPLNMTLLLSTVAAFQTSSMSTDESSVLSNFIKKYGQLRSIPADDNDSILLIYTQYQNFYDNFYSILSENNKRIFRNSNFDIQARLINSINQFNYETMIALHYTLDPNFMVENIEDDAAALDTTTAYASLKYRILQDIQDAINAQMIDKCGSDGAVGAAGGAGAGGAGGTAGAAGKAGATGAGGAAGKGGSDAGSGPVPPYNPPTGSGSLPLVINKPSPLGGSGSGSGSGTASSVVKKPSTMPSCDSLGTDMCNDNCSPSLDQGANWQYMILPSADAAKCSDVPKDEPSLIWGE